MATWTVKVTVEYEYEVEADDEAGAEIQGWDYEEYGHTASVYDIAVEELDEPDEDEE
jgi:hypothetical protein